MSSTFPKVPAVLGIPSVNRGVGFTYEERVHLGLVGRVPAGVLSLQQQDDRVWRQRQGLPNDLALATRAHETVDKAVEAAMWIPEYS